MAILGIDEVGRGPWAGPLVVGACVLGDAKIEGLTDSKKLTPKRRSYLAAQICQQCEYGLGWVYADELDKIGLSAALRKACHDAVKQIDCPFHEIIIDGTINFLSDTQLAPFVQTLKKADLLVPEVSAASIIAKVARDNYMVKIANKYPGYGFEKHVGYGTAAHRQALEKHGVCPEHRKSFRPIAALLGETIAPKTLQKPTSKQLGTRAEVVVAKELERRGHKIIQRNWRNKFCEIDVVSVKDEVWYFTEVKYRSSQKYHSGIDAITPKKQQQMRFAAELFLQRMPNAAARLAVAEVSGTNYKITRLTTLE